MKQTFERMKRRLLPVVGATLTATLLLPVQSAQAATALDPVPTAYTLTRIDGDKSALISSAESAGVAKASITGVLGARTGRPSLCHGTGMNGALRYDGFCWDDTDDRTGYTDKNSDPALNGGWMPQGFTGSHDATDSGLYAGQHLYAASWYFGNYENSKANEQYSRISLVKSTGDTVTYGHVALVEPTSGNFKEPAYVSHADGLAWYGDRLYVANGVELQVYDLRHLWKMTDAGPATKGATGLGKDAQGNVTTSARYHSWALPLVARYTTKPEYVADAPGTDVPDRTKPGSLKKNQPFPDSTDTYAGNPRSCGPKNGVVCLSSLSVDRSTSSLVSVENRKEGGARIVRWPLGQLAADSTVVNSRTTGYTTPVFNVQGTATDGTNFYMSGDCPTSWPKGFSCVHVAAPGQAPRVLTQSAWLTQGLSWDPNAKRLWGLNEALEDSAGPHRVVFSLDPSAGREVDGWSWISNFNKPGSVCATPAGENTANGTVVTVYHCTGAASQRWAFVDGRLVHKASGKCLTPRGDAEGTDGTVLTLWTCSPSALSQLFYRDGATITNRLGKAITPKGDSLADGVWLTLWTNNRANVQEWSVKGF
ncbi:RICIN domain-containing protein [Streptomyces sp. NPDC086771]|uniref:RICIN domain-containing protein n=1 Tax=unclassified Streptomyces TaxID=2593676 RepID=UPI0037FC8DDC